MRESRDQSGSLRPKHLSFSRPESPPFPVPFVTEEAADISFLQFFPCHPCSCLSKRVPRAEHKPHPSLQSAGVKRNYCCALLGWAWWNYPKAVFIMPLNLVPMFNVLSTLTPGVSLLRCSPHSHPTVCGLEGHP